MARVALLRHNALRGAIHLASPDVAVKTKKLILSTAFGTVLVAVTLVGIELVASFLTPAWPAYLLRPVPISRDAVSHWHSSMPDITFATNAWLMRDRERSITKPDGSAFRSVFIGDSFLEGGFTRAALPARNTSET